MKASPRKEGLGVVIPVHFPSDVEPELIGRVLEETLDGQEAFCPHSQCLMVVDRGTRADAVLTQAPASSPLSRVGRDRLERNRGKAGSVCRGIRRLLRDNDLRWIVSRDCDGDHLLDDLPRFLRLAGELESHHPLFAIFGARSSYAKSMGWVRQEWEKLTNRLFLDCTAYLAATRGQVLDRRYWNRWPLDLQCGYRLYSRQAALLAVQGLEELPDDPEVYTFANEMLPFLDLSLAGGSVGQVPCTSRTGQLFSNYASFDMAARYGRFLAYVVERYEIPADSLHKLVDGRLFASHLFWSDQRQQVLRFRSLLCPQAPDPIPPRHV